MTIEKTMDRKLAELARDPEAKCFILADAKDADMARGIASPGKRPDGSWRSMTAFHDDIREIVERGLVDIMLMSASTSDRLTIGEGLFRESPVTPAVRANDTTDIHVVTGGRYTTAPCRNFATTTIDHIQAGKSPASADERGRGANLGLYSMTFNNLPDADLALLEAYKAFRLEAEAKGFDHFLEVFAPNVSAEVHGLAPEQIPAFMNDHIVRLLAGIPYGCRPRFLKIPYMGARATEALHNYDPAIVIGVLGGSAGTTRDAFELVAQSKKYGARVALFGRKILAAENQVAFLQHMRHVADDEMTPDEAVRAYHGELAKRKLTPHRALADDLALTDTVFGYAG